MSFRDYNNRDMEDVERDLRAQVESLREECRRLRNRPVVVFRGGEGLEVSMGDKGELIIVNLHSQKSAVIRPDTFGGYFILEAR